MTRAVPATLLAIALLSGCLDRADVDRTLGPESPGYTYPDLLPTADLLRLEPADPEAAEALIEELRDRAKALRRAARTPRKPGDLADELDARADALRERVAEPGG